MAKSKKAAKKVVKKTSAKKVSKKKISLRTSTVSKKSVSSGNNNKVSAGDFRQLLMGMKERIMYELKQMSTEASSTQKDGLGDSSGHALHMADVATDMYDREFSLGLASNDRELLYKVESALERIASNAFGICTECKKPIASIRLKAIPYAETCLKCQEQLESK